MKTYFSISMFAGLLWILSVPVASAQVSRLMGDQYTYSATNLRGNLGETQDPVDEFLFEEHDTPPAILTFDGIAETVGGITVNERAVKWDGIPGGIPVVQDAGIDGETEFDALGWESPGEVVEFQFDSVDGRWVSEDLLDHSFITLRDLEWQNSDPGEFPFFFEDGFYMYYTKDGVGATGYSVILEGIGILVGAHPFDESVPEVFYLAYSRGQVEEVSKPDEGSVDLTFGTTQLNADASWAALAQVVSADGLIDVAGRNRGFERSAYRISCRSSGRHRHRHPG